MWWTTEKLVWLWSEFSDSHHSIWSWFWKPWEKMGEFLVWVGTLSVPVQVFFIAISLSIGLYLAVQYEREHKAHLVVRLARSIATTIAFPPMLAVLMTSAVEFIAGVIFYAVWVTIGLVVFVFAFHSYIIEAGVRGVSSFL